MKHGKKLLLTATALLMALLLAACGQTSIIVTTTDTSSPDAQTEVSTTDPASSSSLQTEQPTTADPSIDPTTDPVSTGTAVLPTDTSLTPSTDPTLTPTTEPTPTPSVDPTTDMPTDTHTIPNSDPVNWCDHEHTTAVPDLAPTCTVDGYKGRMKCTDCGAILDGTGIIIPAYGHRYNNLKCIYCSKNKPSLVTGGQYEGTGVIWQLYDDGELAISGKGAVPSFPEDENSFFFGYNKVVKSIVVYAGVTSIGDNAFRNLKDAVTISISSTVRSIGDHAFDGWCLKDLNLSYGLTTVGKDNFTGNQIFFLELPGSLQSVGAGSFSSAQMVTLRVPASVTRFDAYENQYSNLRNVAFMGDEASASKLDLYRHLRCDSATSCVEMHFQFTAKASSLAYCTKRGSISGDFTYNVYSDGTCIVTAYRGSSADIVVPEKLGTNTVIGIEHECFKNNKTIKSITLPATLKYIYYKAFIDSSLETLTILGDGVKLGEAAFSGCSNLKTLNMKGSFAEIGGKSLANTKIETIPLSPSMKVARVSSFASSSVKNVNYKQFEIIENSAFARTTATDIDLSGVKEIGYGAFYSVGLKTLNVTNVGSIAHAAFISNRSLTKESVTGLNTVGQIAEGAFDFEA